MSMVKVVLGGALLWLVMASGTAQADPAFQAFLQSLWPEAQRLGVTRQVFDAATRGLDPDLSLPDLVLPGKSDRKPPAQAEFVQTPADYVREASIARRSPRSSSASACRRR
jgi:membrane-bound lytic murein transglycosylase B